MSRKVFYMHDNHTFSRMPEGLVATLAKLEQLFEEGENYGSLCCKADDIPHDQRMCHAGADFKSFALPALKWLQYIADYKSPGDLEYGSWVVAPMKGMRS